jgi:hypothetical protein
MNAHWLPPPWHAIAIRLRFIVASPATHSGIAVVGFVDDAIDCQ